MAMRNTEKDFYGRQTDEKILYVVRPHSISTAFSLAKTYLVAVAMFVVLTVLGTQIPGLTTVFSVAGILLFLLTSGIGTKIVLDWESRDIAYITDRRLIRFEPTTLFATNSRTLAWDEVVKVKTYPTNFVFKEMAIGNIVAHARTPGRLKNEEGIGEVMADDIELKDVYLYKDLGNYIDKILFTYKQRPKEMDKIHKFIPKPKGERY